jgi:hypothetical protein
MKPTDILIVQTGSGGVALVSSVLRREGIIRNRNYIASTNTGILDEYVTKDTPQLLIINSFTGDLPAVKKLIEEKRKMNPQLIALLVECSIQSLDPDETFEDCIDMIHPDWFKTLYKRIRDFNSGTLRRRTREPASA